tara:strand:+ start:2166 stop:2663 length:498 start_codon:yes stop_codon:yes gene_type:complete
MKNLILTIAILVTGVINAQSFQKVKELRWANSESLTDLGFDKQAKKDSVYFKLWNFNENADLWINSSTREIVKISESAIEYIYDNSTLINKRTWPVIFSENISSSLIRSLRNGFSVSLFLRDGYIDEEDMDIAITAGLYKKFKKQYLWRVLKTNDLSNNSFVVFY